MLKEVELGIMGDITHSCITVVDGCHGHELKRKSDRSIHDIRPGLTTNDLIHNGRAGPTGLGSRVPARIDISEAY